MRRIHHTRDTSPIVFDNSRTYNQVNTYGGIKPSGFWYSIDDGWLKWCEGQGLSSWIGKYTYEVDLGPANMLILKNEKEVRQFSKEYVLLQPQYYLSSLHMFLNWKRVAERYDGIEIPVYSYNELRFELMWYNGWDCASGVIWNVQNVRLKEITL